jgi:lipopolysaccharide export system protein LptA
VIEFLLMGFFLASPLAQATDGGSKEADAAAKAKPAPAAPRHPVEITAEKLELLGKRNQAVWSGNVRARRGSTDLRCDRLVATYTRAHEISRIECIGSVEVDDGNKWAKGERASFDNVTGLLQLTGSPEARQGPNHMRGTKVTFNVGKDVIQVENARTVFETTSKGVPALPRGEGARRQEGGP